MQLHAHHQHTEQWSSHHTIQFQPNMPADIWTQLVPPGLQFSSESDCL